MNAARLCLLLGISPIVLSAGACSVSREMQLTQEVSQLRAQLQQAREQSHAHKSSCSALERDTALALASARQLRADTQYLRASTARMSDAVTRLNYEEWDKVVPEVQLAFGDVESAANDLDSRVGRVLIALHAESEK